MGHAYETRNFPPPPGVLSAMKLRVFAVLALGFVSLAAFARADHYPHKESFSRTAALSPTGSLSLKSVNGSVTIETWDRDEILIEGEKSAKTVEDLKAIDLALDLSATRADIQVRLPKRSGGWFGDGSLRGAVTFRIKVPATVALEKIDTVNASIQINGLRGRIDAETVNGRIRATDLAGDASLRTVNGPVDASFVSISPGQQLALQTVNGAVHVALPPDAGLEVRSSVVNGHITCDFPLQLSGKIRPKHINGAIGDARASLHARSVNGAIHLEKL